MSNKRFVVMNFSCNKTFLQSVPFFYLIKKMKTKGVETRNGFYSPGRLPIYNKFKTSHLKNSNKLSKNVICLPFFTSLKRKEISFVVKTLLSFKKT